LHENHCARAHLIQKRGGRHAPRSNFGPHGLTPNPQRNSPQCRSAAG
jgi:hypothetical protein